MGIGRPTKYKEEYAELAYKFCLLGATNEKLARCFDVAVSTIDKWIAEIEPFSGAVKAGREEADCNVASSLYHRACGYSHKEEKVFNNAGEIVTHETIKHYPPDTAAAFIWLKNRAGWTDRKEIEHDVSESLTERLQRAAERAKD